MAVISFLMDNREGHIIPSLKLALDLKERGHSVHYLTTLDNEALIRDLGFDFFPIFREIYPKGFNQVSKTSKDPEALIRVKRTAHLSAIMRGVLDDYIQGNKSAQLIASAYLNLEMVLLHYRYKIFPVMLTPYTKAPGTTIFDECVNDMLGFPGDVAAEIVEFVSDTGIDITSLRDLLQPLNRFHELIPCPQELEIVMPLPNNRIHYIGPSISRRQWPGEMPDRARIGEGKKIVYASLGSYASSYGDVAKDFYCKLIRVFALPAAGNLHLILPVGAGSDPSGPDSLPENVTVLKWASQTEILDMASLAITHGGLGTIKESIFYGVPMIVFPVRYDQPWNADIVCHHGLGIRGQIGAVTETELLDKIFYVLGSEEIRENIGKMRKVFQEKEAEGAGVSIVEGLINGQSGG